MKCFCSALVTALLILGFASSGHAVGYVTGYFSCVCQGVESQPDWKGNTHMDDCGGVSGIKQGRPYDQSGRITNNELCSYLTLYFCNKMLKNGSTWEYDTVMGWKCVSN